MKCIFVILLVHLAFISVGTAIRWDYTYLPETGAYYKIHNTEYWPNANRYCTNEGATLFYPEDEQEAIAVIELWNQTYTVDHFYVGISDLGYNGFETVDGRPIEAVYNRWGEGEPNHRPDEHCVVMRRDATYNDDKCDRYYNYICKATKDADDKHWQTAKTLDYNYPDDVLDYSYTHKPTEWYGDQIFYTTEGYNETAHVNKAISMPISLYLCPLLWMLSFVV